MNLANPHGSRLSGRSLRRAGAGALSLIGAIAASPGAAAGDPIGAGPPDSFFFADSSTQGFCLGNSLTDRAHLYFVAQMDYLDDATDMADFGPTSCSSAVDIVGHNFNLAGNRKGSTSCQVPPQGDVCTSADVFIDEVEVATSPYPTPGLQKTICHEIGHTVGLTHYKVAAYPGPPEGQEDCMRSGDLPNGDPIWRTYSVHHKNEINFVY